MNTSRTYSAVKEHMKAKFSWKYAGGALGVAVVVLLLSLVQPWSTTAYELSDSGVWVSKGGDLGRVNTQVAQMDFVGNEKGRQIQVENEKSPLLVQGGRSVFLVAKDGKSIEAPQPEQPLADPKRMEISAVKELALGGGTGDGQVVVARTETEVLLVARGGTLLPSPQPLMKVGPKSQVVVGSGGTVVAYSPQVGKNEATLQYLELGTEDVRKETLNPAPGENTTLTIIGEQVVLLDTKAQQLLLPGADPISLDDLKDPQVQVPGPAAKAVVLADEQKLLSVDLKSGDIEIISSNGDGNTPVRPAVDADCVHGAWKLVVVARCGGGTLMTKDFESDSESDSGSWYFRTGGVSALLTNPVTGNSWMVFDRNGLQKVLWPEPKKNEDENKRVEETPPNRAINEKPVAKPDELGARARKVTYLKVLGNDTDPNRDPILVSEVRSEGDPNSPESPKFAIAQGGRSIKIDMSSVELEGQTYGFTYKVSDGQLSSDPVDSTVRIVPDVENNPPTRLPKPDLAFDAVPNEKVNYDLLTHFSDPDGDPIILSEARVDDPALGDKVSFDPTGFIYFTSAGKTSSVTATVQDVPPDLKLIKTVSAQVQARVSAEAKPPIARNDVVEVVVGTPKTVQPLLNDSDPNGDELTLMPDSIAVLSFNKNDITFSPPERNSFELTASVPGYYTLSYKVTDDGIAEIEGRITVKASDEAQSSLVALTDVVIVNVGSTATVDLLANDSDATGAVLSVVDFSAPIPDPIPDLECSTAQLSGSVLNDFTTFQVVALDAAIPAVCKFSYKVTNGLPGVSGVWADVVVIIHPKPANTRPELIHPEPFNVRAEQVGLIPLGAFAQDAEGDAITVSLDPAFPLPAGHGQIYQSGNDLKYVAPQDPPAEPVEVHVLISDQYTSNTPLAGIVKIQVNQADMPPEPKDVTVRVRAGQVISIPVSLEGGDRVVPAVELTRWEPFDRAVAVAGKPEVDSVSQTLRFTAPGVVPSPPTTKFKYFVRDTNRAEVSAIVAEVSAIVTVQFSPQDKNHKPIAVPDKVIAQRNSPIWINPAGNDTDLDGDLLKVEDSNSASPDCKAEPDGDRLKITAQSNCTIDYSISDYNPTDIKFASAKSEAQRGIVSVTVADKYSGLRPIARDDYAQPTGSDGKFARVNVLANDEDPDGRASELTIDFGDDSKSISQEDLPGNYKIELQEKPQRLQYSITDDQGLKAVAFVWVPSQAKNRSPVERPNHQPIQAKVAEPKEIKLADYIIDPDTEVGTDLIFSEVTSDQAANSASLNDKLSQGIIVFTPKDLPGLGQIHVTATERGGEKLSSPIVLAVRILPADNVPPTWLQTNPCDVQVEQDSAGNPEKVKKVALRAFAADPDDPSKDGLSFSGKPALQSGVTAETTPAGVFTASASEDATVGPGGSVTVNLTDAAGDEAEKQVTCEITVIDSTEPPVRVKSVTLETTQGKPLMVEIASLLEVPGKGATFSNATVQPVEGSVQASGTTLTYTSVKEFAGNANIAFTVKEKHTSNGAARTATGNIAVLVKGRPTDLTAPKADGGTLSDAKIVLTYGAANPNYDPSPVTYSVKSTSGGVAKDCGTALTCTVDAGDGVKNAIDYAFVVTAKNATGISETSPPSNVVQTDVKPSPPTNLRLTVEGDTTLTFAFDPPKAATNSMSPIIGFDCILNGSTSARVTTPTCSFPGLTNGTEYKLAVKTITAKSESEQSAPATGNPYGAPIITSPSLTWVSADGDMTLRATALVDDNGRPATSTWAISCPGQSSKSNPATFSCPKIAGPITATITAVNDRGNSSEKATYEFPDKPTVIISSVESGLEQLTVNAQGTGETVEYSLNKLDWQELNKLKSNPDEPTKVYVRACSPEWPECGDVKDYQGIAYGQAPKPTCDPEGPGPEPAEDFTCNLSVNGASENFSHKYYLENVLIEGTALTVKCAQTATVRAQYAEYGDSKSDPLKVFGPNCPSTPTEPLTPG